jgi:hypothetical protein
MVFLLTWFLHQDSLSLVVIYWQPQYFRFFQSPSFLFSHKFCTIPSFGSGFDDAGFVAFTSLLRSLPFNFHLFPVCPFHKVQFGLEDLLFQRGTPDLSPLLDFNLHLFSSNLLFGLGRSICYFRQVFLGYFGLGYGGGSILQKVINSSSRYATLLSTST